MKAKTKLTKLWTILLSLVMLLSLLPTTALAATYPGSVRVYNASGALLQIMAAQPAMPAALPMSPATTAVRCTSRTTTALRQMAKFMRTAT